MLWLENTAKVGLWLSRSTVREQLLLLAWPVLPILRREYKFSAMLLHRTGLLDLDYDMEYDTLSFTWPVLKGVEADEIEHSFHLLIDSIKHYDIKRLLIDSSGSTADLGAGDFHDLVISLSKHFLETRLEKIARIASHDPIKESQTEKVSGELSVTSDTRIFYRNFPDLESAVLWLRE